MLESSRLRINKSCQSLRGVDTVTDPKTPKSVRTIVMPTFLRDEMAASYGELSESLQRRIELVMGFFLALGEGVDAPAVETSPRTTPLEESATTVMGAKSNNASIFGMGRG